MIVHRLRTGGADFQPEERLWAETCSSEARRRADHICFMGMQPILPPEDGD